MIKLENNPLNARQLAGVLKTTKTVPVFDMDGVFADATHRQICKPDGSLDLEKYRENSTAEKIAQDKPLPMIETLKLLQKHGVDYHICTARVVCKNTMNWIHDNGLTPKSVMARSHNADTRKDYRLKEINLRSRFHAHDLQNMVLIDDNLANCKMAERIGMCAINVPFIGH